MTHRERPFRSWLAWEAGCLGELVFWWLVLPAAAVFLWLVFFAGDLVVVSAWLYGVVVLVLVLASLVVLFTALLGHLRAKRIAATAQPAEAPETEVGSSER